MIKSNIANADSPNHMPTKPPKLAMNEMNTDVRISHALSVGAKRTPFGTFGGALKSKTPTELGEIAARGALQAAGVDPKLVNSVTVGTVIQIAANDTPIIPRGLVLRLGIPLEVPALCVNIQCGSGFQAIMTGAQVFLTVVIAPADDNDIVSNDCDITLAVGAESMSLTPFMVITGNDERRPVWGQAIGHTTGMRLEDGLWEGLKDHNCNIRMGETAEKLAKKYQISREGADAIALRSQQRWADAYERGVFKEEVVPVPIKLKGKDVMFDTDEHPKPKTTADQLAKLWSVFERNGTVTAGNASGVNDGAGALVLASEEAVKRHNLKPLARIVGHSCVGVDPTIMGIGPAPAIKKLLAKTGLTLEAMDVIEVNEAFASQFASVEKELGLDPNKTNVNGGAIAIGHPLGATGARIMTNLVYEVRRRKGKYALGSACIGGGQGIAILIENYALGSACIGGGQGIAILIENVN
ncbi:unnamed protein product [Oppiella nova]|uniref:Acetyl-CoA C-acyltransferase n=1 Tax=Oppiella nova TaxID=334625 RepID=A0A7R9QST7_9ACAR|nr:unnamed protein product [Oppiella nova]CAG2174416.1 unnamed protein product [Oppiella nova]